MAIRAEQVFFIKKMKIIGVLLAFKRVGVAVTSLE